MEGGGRGKKRIKKNVRTEGEEREERKWEEREKNEIVRKREVYCYSGITVLACTTNVHWPVYGATRYPLSPSALGCPWTPVLSQHPLPPTVSQSLQSHNLKEINYLQLLSHIYFIILDNKLINLLKTSFWGCEHFFHIRLGSKIKFFNLKKSILFKYLYIYWYFYPESPL